MTRRFGIMAAILILSLAALACSDEGSVTGTFGNSTVRGQVVLADELAGSRADGIGVRVLGTGLSGATDTDGRFEISGVSEGDVELQFERASDGIEATVQGSTFAPLQVQLGSRSRRRGVKGPLRQIEGKILAISPTSITVHTESRGDFTAVITPTTVIRKGNQTLTTLDLAIGDQVHVKAMQNPDTTLTAVEIKLQNEDDEDGDDDATATANGNVFSLGVNELVVQTHNGLFITVQVNDQTNIKRQGTRIPFSEIHLGDRIESQGTRVNATTILAKKINIEPGSNNGH